ncbi:MAG TPA: hypothetical protein VN737_10955 [Bryobacteraceae bacterium]|jgi:hypothetical protein|nr:hypothetical protein [Bryobacteraceae bacterium]
MKVSRFAQMVAVSLFCFQASGQMLDSHQAKYAADGQLLPWTSFRDAIDREMNWYLKCPIENGYPRFVWMTFMDGNYEPVQSRLDFIPAMQNSAGIISYLKYYEYTGNKTPAVLRFARYMGDYLVKESLTPDTGKYPRFPRSTGLRGKFPQPADAGCQRDRLYEIEPDKGGMAGYALMLLYEATGEERYRSEAVHIAKTLTANMLAGDGDRSPWPFRVDYRTGDGRGTVSGNMTFILRLYDKLLASGYAEFQQPRAALWTWIRDYQIPSAGPKQDGRLWAQFFEDHDDEHNRTAWAPLNLARYLIEKKEAIDPDWKEHAHGLIEFVNQTFTSVRFGVAVSGEQDQDRIPWGGVNSTYGAVLAMYSAATGSPEYRSIARQALTLCLYAVEDDGHPFDTIGDRRGRGWQEDAHTDKIHNIVDAITAFPEWANWTGIIDAGVKTR